MIPCGKCRGLSDYFICAERATEEMRLKATGRRINDLQILTQGKRQGWSGAGSGDGIFGSRRCFLRSRVRQGYELLLSSLTDLVPTVLEEPYLSPLNNRLDSAHVNLSAGSMSSGMCDRLLPLLFCDYDTTINFLLVFFFASPFSDLVTKLTCFNYSTQIYYVGECGT
jgi:hypothetical protein